MSCLSFSIVSYILLHVTLLCLWYTCVGGGGYFYFRRNGLLLGKLTLRPKSRQLLVKGEFFRKRELSDVYGSLTKYVDTLRRL